MSRSIEDDPVAQFGAGAIAVGVLGKATALKLCVLSTIKGGVLVGGIVATPVAIAGGVLIIGAACLNQKFKWW